MAVDCGEDIPSKSKPQPAGVMSYVNPANLLSFRCFVFDFQFWCPNCNFSLVFHEFHESSTNSSVCKHFSSIFFQFPYPNFFSISHQTVTFRTFSANLEKILHIRLCHPASFNVPLCYHLSSPVLKIFVAASFSF